MSTHACPATSPVSPKSHPWLTLIVSAYSAYSYRNVSLKSALSVATVMSA